MKEVQSYEAFDGSLHLSEDACRVHEMKDPARALIGLTEDQVKKILAREDVARADALEAAAYQVKKIRISGGVFRRKPKPAHAEC